MSQSRSARMQTPYSALLSRRSEQRDVFVVARLLDDLAERENKHRDNRSPDGRLKDKN